MMGPMYAPKPKCRDTDYIDFLIATPQGVLLHGGRRACNPNRPTPRPTTPSPGCCTASSPTPRPSGARPSPWSTRDGGVLVLDDSTLDKPYAKKIELVTRHWSGKHKRVVRGINLITPGLDRRRPQHPLRLPALRQGQRRPDQERPLPGDAPARPRRRGFAPRVRRSSTAGTRGLENLKQVRGLRLDVG